MNDIWRLLLDKTEAKKQLVFDAVDYIWKNPELGYKEWKTNAYMQKAFEELGYEVKPAGDIPGFTAELVISEEGPTVAVLGELDSLLCTTHPECDPTTGAVHACGHCCQSSYLVGLAAVMKEAFEEGLLGKCAGRIRFVSVPAEETIDMEFRNELISKGIIKYMAGKIEFLYRGYLDGVDLAFMMHADVGKPHVMEIFDGSDGCITKHMEFEGKAAHAGVAPWEGINAAYMASLGLQACNSLRETFREKDYVRFHPIISQAGLVANAIPGIAKLDAYSRAADVDTMIEVNRKMNRAMAASAAAMGGNFHVIDKPGNLPLHNSKELNALFADVVTDIWGADAVLYGPWQTSSCDMGDLSSVMPVTQPMITGVTGTVHGADFTLGDKEKSCVNPVRIMSIVLFELLYDNGKRAKEIADNYQPVYPSKEAYFAAIDQIAKDERLVVYQEDGTVLLK